MKKGERIKMGTVAVKGERGVTEHNNCVSREEFQREFKEKYKTLFLAVIPICLAFLTTAIVVIAGVNFTVGWRFESMEKKISAMESRLDTMDKQINTKLDSILESKKAK